MMLDDENGDTAADYSKRVNIPIPTFPPTAAVCAVRQPTQSLPRVNTVPMSLVAQALLPPDDKVLSRHRQPPPHGYVCSSCRRCDTATEASSSPAVLHVTSEHANPGIHVARKSPTHPDFTLTRS